MKGQKSGSREESKAVEQTPRGQILHIDPWRNPFGAMQRFADEVDRIFEGFGYPGRMHHFSSQIGAAHFMPEVDLFQREGKLVVRADLPGLSKDDVHVEIGDSGIVIEGERKYEHQSNESGVYRSERSHGQFRREVPLPDGVKTENATATFKNGVLEVTLDAPSDSTSKTRRLEIQGSEEQTPNPEKSAA